MPMNFPDMTSLQFAAEVWKFRAPRHDETEDEFRQALANHVQPKDSVEAQEIRTGKGWDQWSKAEEMEAIMRALKNVGVK